MTYVHTYSRNSIRTHVFRTLNTSARIQETQYVHTYSIHSTGLNDMCTSMRFRNLLHIFTQRVVENQSESLTSFCAISNGVNVLTTGIPHHSIATRACPTELLSCDWANCGVNDDGSNFCEVLFIRPSIFAHLASHPKARFSNKATTFIALWISA